MKNADFDFKNPQQTKFAARAIPYVSQLYMASPNTWGAFGSPALARPNES
jgi:hypothetical protein